MNAKDPLEEMGFGELNPLDRELEEAFGDVYLDTQDLSREISDEWRVREDSGTYVADVSHLLGEVDRRAPVWSCEEAQARMIEYYEEYVAQGEPPTEWQDVWAFLNHSCYHPMCNDLMLMINRDRCMTPEERRARYEGFRAKWFGEE